MPFEPKQITNQIFQGGWILPRDIPELVRLGITHILNLDLPYADPVPFAEANISIHNIHVLDHCLMKPQLIREVMGLIDGCLSSSRHKIYIHCVAGVSRSPTVAWLYLIHAGFSPEEASTRVRPNPVMYDARTVQELMAHRRPFSASSLSSGMEDFLRDDGGNGVVKK